MPYNICIRQFKEKQQAFSQPTTLFTACQSAPCHKLHYQWPSFSMEKLFALLYRSNLNTKRETFIHVFEHISHNRTDVSQTGSVPRHVLALDSRFVGVEPKTLGDQEILCFAKKNFGVDEVIVSPLNIILPMTDNKKPIAGVLQTDGQILHVTNYSQWYDEMHGGPPFE